MPKDRDSWWRKIFWVLLALQILNLSVDSPDGHPFFVAEDLSVNDQESLVEFFVEKILGIHDAFPEFDDPDSSTINVKLVLSSPLTADKFLFIPQMLKYTRTACHILSCQYWQRPSLGCANPPPEC
jgi:hypothetical protein